jgi:hypothetical protein
MLVVPNPVLETPDTCPITLFLNGLHSPPRREIINIEPYALVTRAKSSLDLAIRDTASDANNLNRSNSKPLTAPSETLVGPIYNENL